MEGLWYAHFSAGQVQGDGMAVLRDGEILGGDPAADAAAVEQVCREAACQRAHKACASSQIRGTERLPAPGAAQNRLGSHQTLC